MAPREPFHTLRWEFVPVTDPRDSSIRWKWRGYTQTGKLALESAEIFETLTECMDDAKEHGYGQR